jgi:hypothetical protein
MNVSKSNKLEEDAIRQERINLLNREILIGMDQLERGEGIPGEKAVEMIKEIISKRRNRY